MTGPGHPPDRSSPDRPPRTRPARPVPVPGWCLLLCSLLVAGAALPGAAAGQEEGVRVGIRYEPGYVPGLAVLPVSGGEETAELAARVDEILRRDLDYSDRFEMVTAADSLQADGGVNYGLWNDLGAQWLVRASVSGTRERPILRVSLHDIVYGRLTEVRAFSLPAPGEGGFRMAVHRAADAVVEWATGEPGVAATRIAFRRKRPDGTSDLYVVDSDGENLRRVTVDSSIVYSPQFSPDGRRLLYVSYVDGSPTLFQADVDGGRRRRVDTGSEFSITPAFSPDGAKVAFAASVGDHTEIFEMELDPPCCRRQVTEGGPADALNPAYSPDGRRVAYTANRLGQPHVYVQRVDGSGGPTIVSRYVYGERGYATSPDWSPAADRIAYHGLVNGVFQIMTVNPDGSNRRVLTSRGSNEDPSWAPDGRHLVFASDRGGYRALWILDTVSGRTRRLTVNQTDQMPAWSGRIVRPGGEE